VNTLNKILDNARKVCARDSDAAVAERLKVSRQTVMQWRSGARRITDEHLMAVIEIAHADPALAVLVRQEMAETKAEKKAWTALWDRLSPVTTVVGGLVLAVCMTPALARAKPLPIQGFSGSEGGSMYIMLQARSLPKKPEPPQSSDP